MSWSDLDDRRGAKPGVGIDGYARTPVLEHKINTALAACFKGESGAVALDYLRSITQKAICGPHATDAQLRHTEGMRWVVGLIEKRIEEGNKSK
jgi:hypothetical protein